MRLNIDRQRNTIALLEAIKDVIKGKLWEQEEASQDS